MNINRVNKFGTLKIVSIFVLFLIMMCAVPVSAKNIETETEKTPEVKRSTPIIQNIKPEEITYPIINKTLTNFVQSLKTLETTLSINGQGINLIPNASIESPSSNPTIPTSWNRGGYGSNQKTFSYPVLGLNDSKAVKVSISSYVSGDAKWYFSDIPVIAGKTYIFSDYYKSDTESIVDVRFKMSDGSYRYEDILNLEANSTSFRNTVAEFTVPSGAVSATIFHLIKSNGYLITDEYSIIEKEAPSTDPESLISNPGFENSSNGIPTDWIKGGWGSNSRTFSYPTVSVDQSKSATVNITKYTSGDAKWAFKPISVPAGTYSYSDQYKSNIESFLTLEIQYTNGSYEYQDLAVVEPSLSFSTINTKFTVPEGAKAIRIFHLIKKVGYLTLDNVSIKAESTSGIFNTGGVTFRFDDGWLSQYTNAMPILQNAGIKGSFFIVTDRTPDNGFPGYMSKSQIKDLYNKGNEIGSHTISHTHLNNLTTSEQINEIEGSRSSLLSLGVGPVNSFVYPFGEYNASVLNIVKNTGYSNAVTTMLGYNTPTTDEYQLQSKSIKKDMTFNDIKSMIDGAISNKKWFIMGFHRVDNDSDIYSTTPEMFRQIVDYVSSNNIPVVTIEQGAEQMAK